MNSIPYPENTTKKSVPSQLAKAAILLVISLGLLWFTIDFPIFRLFEPHTCPGGRCQGSTGWRLWVSYSNDLILPFAFYFFICLGGNWLKTWQGRALLAFGIPSLLEIGQALYHQFPTGRYLGSFDLLDIVMYAMGVGLAVVVEQKVFAKILKFW